MAWVADRYAPLEVLGRDGDWTEVKELNGSSGWAHGSVLASGSCAIVAGTYANVRSGPGFEHDILWEVDLGYPFKVTEVRGDWLRVTDDGEVEGWIARRLVWGSIPQEGGR